MAERKDIAKAHLLALAEFYRNMAVGLMLAFMIGGFAEGLSGLFQSTSELWFFGLLAVISVLYSQRLLERAHA
jgi:hypothetical protein